MNSERLPGEHRVHITGFDATTGNPSAVRSEFAPQVQGNYVQRALEHSTEYWRHVGPGGDTGARVRGRPASPADQQRRRGVHVQQQYKGITIFDAAQAVRFAPDGSLAETVGSNVTVVQDLPVAPTLSVQAAVRLAAEYVATPGEDEQDATTSSASRCRRSVSISAGFQPQIVASFSRCWRAAPC